MSKEYEDWSASPPAEETPEYREVAPEKRAEELGLDILWPEPNELFLDIDTSEDLECAEHQLLILKSIEPGTTWTIGPSRNRIEGRHIVVTLPREVSSELERLGMQAMLGSDRKRELLGMRRLRTGMTRSTCFFVKRDER